MLTAVAITVKRRLCRRIKATMSKMPHTGAPKMPATNINIPIASRTELPPATCAPANPTTDKTNAIAATRSGLLNGSRRNRQINARTRLTTQASKLAKHRRIKVVCIRSLPFRVMHRLHMESDSEAVTGVLPYFVISTHRPCVRPDLATGDSPPMKCLFQSTLPRRERQTGGARPH